MSVYDERITELVDLAKSEGVDSESAQRIFAEMCYNAHQYWWVNVVSVRNLADICNLTVYRTRKAIYQLRNLGLVRRTTCGCPAVVYESESGLDMWCEARPPLNGFGLTAKGYDSATCRRAEEFILNDYVNRHEVDTGRSVDEWNFE